ncbi:hypothetical protein [Flexithrix dorotheae]|uniref:hypothetical protein n=1 Tax=Flexithrix dorotheae TaxID=70993 RepID=UPI000372ECFC|nr:hypothetical protein [Flexithrix dorotheae]
MREEILDDFGSSQSPYAFEEKAERLIYEGYEVRTGFYISRAFEVFQRNAGGFIGFALVTLAINIGLSFLPIIGNFATTIVNAPLAIGWAIVTSKILREEPFEFGDFFKGFDLFSPLALGGFISGVLIGIGLILLLIPGIYLAVGYMWVSFIIYYGKQEFWPAMEFSRKIISKNWFSFLGLGVVILLLNAAGAIVFGIGLLVTVPVSYIALYLSYVDIVESLD